MNQFENKIVLVTGAGSGIGEATAILFAKAGADIAIVDYNEKNLNKAAEKCKAFGKRVLALKKDVSKDEEAKSAIEETIKKFGRLDVLVNNAGIVREGKLLDGTIMNSFDEIMRTNLRAVVHMTSLATPHLIKSKGCVVNTSSIASTQIKSGSSYPTYGMTKAGVDYFTRLAAYELAENGVRVNCVNPGPVYTSIHINCNLNLNMDNFRDVTALKRCSGPEEVGDLILYLASDKAKGITGSSFAIDNGASLI